MLKKGCFLACFGALICVVFMFQRKAIPTLPTIGILRLRDAAAESFAPLNESVYSAVHSADGFNRSEKTHVDIDNFKPCREPSEDPGCQRRLPQAIIFGVKKCGTLTLRRFLSFHPYIAFPVKHETHYFDFEEFHAKGPEWYRQQMALSRPEQITIEKTPNYFTSEIAPRGIHDEVSPTTKLIAILRDPVERAISDHVHVLSVHGLTDRATQNVTDSQMSPPYLSPIYEVKQTFERSVLNGGGTIKEWNALVNTGFYSNHMQRWLDVFPRHQMLVLDAGEFTKNPLAPLKKVERFLGLPHFFRKRHFYFNKEKGFYCYNIAGERRCMERSKGRKHPKVRSDVLDKLRDLYEPYNHRLVEMLNQNFSWIQR